MNKNEIWKPVLNYEGLYEVSNFGRVKSLISGKILKLTKQRNGYLQVGLCKDRKQKKFLVHRLVYMAFNGEIPAGLEVNHINDKDKTDNRLCNLNLMTHKENLDWGMRTEKTYKPVIAYDKFGNLIQEFKSLRKAAIWLGKSKADSHICNNLKGRIPSAYGYIWRYKN